MTWELLTEINPFLFQVTFGHGVHRSNRKQSEMLLKHLSYGTAELLWKWTQQSPEWVTTSRNLWFHTVSDHEGNWSSLSTCPVQCCVVSSAGCDLALILTPSERQSSPYLQHEDRKGIQEVKPLSTFQCSKVRGLASTYAVSTVFQLCLLDCPCEGFMGGSHGHHI